MKSSSYEVSDVAEARIGLASDIDFYEGELRRFLSGQLSDAELKPLRTARGVYEQRQDGRYMVRVRVAAGVIAIKHALRLSELSRRFGDGNLHITTRQDVQLHGVSLQDTPEIMRRLLDAGLLVKGSGGDAIRNVTACPYAGVCPQERFDVTETAMEVSERVAEPAGGGALPRKFKISFSGCRADCGLAQVSDLGFIARCKGGLPGYRVFVGGGMGAHSRIAGPLLEWTPADEAVRVAEAVRRLFERHGDRLRRQRARLRFVLEQMGDERFRGLFDEELNRVVEDGWPRCGQAIPLNSAAPADGRPCPASYTDDGVSCLRQRQEGLVALPLHLSLGLISADGLSGVARLASEFSRDRTLRATRGQELQMRSVPSVDLPRLVERLRFINPGFVDSGSLRQSIVSCTGAATCRLGLCLSRGMASACVSRLSETGLDRATLGGIMIRISGCLNACSHHPIASIGLAGCLRKVADRMVPCYRITMGGGCGGEGARFGAAIGQVPAKAVPELLSEAVRDFVGHRRSDETFLDYFDRRGKGHFVEMSSRHAEIPSFELRPDFYRDFGAEDTVSSAGADGRGPH